jgi:hypothetical protein
MKISTSNNSWVKSKYNQSISHWVNLGSKTSNKKIIAYKKLRPHNQFLAWPSCPKRHLSFLSGLMLQPGLNLKAVEQFLKRHAALVRGEPLLRTSPLLTQKNQESHAAVLEKAVAIQRMARLMHETVASIKLLTVIRDGHHRG